MKKTLTFSMKTLVISMTIILCTSCNNTQQKTADDAGTTDKNVLTEDLNEANNQLYAGLNAMFTGDLEPLNNLW